MSEELHTFIEPELEARITAMVLGEASEFETDELERLIKEKPELAILKKRIEMIHGQLGETMNTEPDEDWQLSSDRRGELLEEFKTTPNSQAKEHISFSNKAQLKSVIGIAASVTVCVVIYQIAKPFGQTKATAENPVIVSYNAPEPPSLSQPSPEFSTEFDFSKDTTIAFNDQASEVTISGNISSVGAKEESLAMPSAPVSRRNRPAPPVPSTSAAKVITSNSVSSVNVPIPEEAITTETSEFGHEIAFGGSWRDDTFSDDTGFDSFSAEKDVITAGNRSRSFAMAGSNIDTTLNDNERAELEEESTAATLHNLNSPALTHENIQQVETLRRNLYTAEGYYNLGKYDEALAQYQSVLEVDKYNKPARRGMEKINSTQADYYRAAYDQTRAQMLMDVDSAWELEISARGKKKEITSKPVQAPRKANTHITKETSTAVEPYSTFSLNVSDVSFQLAKVALLEKDQQPDASKIRPEEFVNAFDYGDPTPQQREPVSCVIEQSIHPFAQQRNFVRISMKTAALGRSTPLNLTLLLDNSGSMEREDRETSVQAAVDVLTQQLKPDDVVSLVSFATNQRLIADRLTGSSANQLSEIVANTPSEGGTNLEEALITANGIAQRQYSPDAQNRVVLITDGVTNLGNTIPAELSNEIVKMREQGIAFDALGIGAEGLNDKILESLTRKGDGRYYFLNRPEDANSSFAQQIAGALNPAAKNVKVQVVFNSKRVPNYRLVGFEKHRLNKEDFRNDKVDAAEMAGEEAGNAIYQVEVNPDGEGDLGMVFVRFLDVNSGRMVERSWTLPYDSQAKPFDLASPSMQLAGTAALLGEKLSGKDGGQIQLDELTDTLGKLRHHYATNKKVQDLIRMCEKAK